MATDAIGAFSLGQATPSEISAQAPPEISAQAPPEISAQAPPSKKSKFSSVAKQITSSTCNPSNSATCSSDFDHDDFGRPIIKGKVVKFLSQTSGALKSRRNRVPPIKKGRSGSVDTHGGELVKYLSQTPNAQKLRRWRDQARARNETVSENPEPDQSPVEKRVREMLAAIEAKKEAGEKEPSTSELPLISAKAPPAKKSKFSSVAKQIISSTCNPSNSATCPSDFDHDDSGQLTFGGKAVMCVPQTPNAQKMRQYSDPPGQEGYSGSQILHNYNGYLLKELSQTSRAKAQRKQYRKIHNQTVSSTNPKPHGYQFSANARVEELLLEAAEKARVREKESSTSALPPESSAFIPSKDLQTTSEEMQSLFDSTLDLQTTSEEMQSLFDSTLDLQTTSEEMQSLFDSTLGLQTTSEEMLSLFDSTLDLQTTSEEMPPP